MLTLMWCRILPTCLWQTIPLTWWFAQMSWSTCYDLETLFMRLAGYWRDMAEQRCTLHSRMLGGCWDGQGFLTQKMLEEQWRKSVRQTTPILCEMPYEEVVCWAKQKVGNAIPFSYVFHLMMVNNCMMSSTFYTFLHVVPAFATAVVRYSTPARYRRQQSSATIFFPKQCFVELWGLEAWHSYKFLSEDLNIELRFSLLLTGMTLCHLVVSKSCGGTQSQWSHVHEFVLLKLEGEIWPKHAVGIKRHHSSPFHTNASCHIAKAQELCTICRIITMQASPICGSLGWTGSLSLVMGVITSRGFCCCVGSL